MFTCRGRAGNPARAATPSAVRAFFAVLRHAEASVHEARVRIAYLMGVFALSKLDSPNLFRAPRDGRGLVDPRPAQVEVVDRRLVLDLDPVSPRCGTLVKGRLFAFFISIFIPFA